MEDRVSIVTGITCTFSAVFVFFSAALRHCGAIMYTHVVGHGWVVGGCILLDKVPQSGLSGTGVDNHALLGAVV